MGRDKFRQPCRIAKKAAEAEGGESRKGGRRSQAAAQPHRIKAHRAPEVISLDDKGKSGGGKGGGNNRKRRRWLVLWWKRLDLSRMPRCARDKDKCFKCMTPPKNATCFAQTATSSSASSSSSSNNNRTAAAASAAPSAEPAEATIILKEWQRLPRQLLQQITDKQFKGPKPDFQLHRVRGELRCKVKLKIPKGMSTSEVTYDCPLAATSSQDAYQKGARTRCIS